MPTASIIKVKNAKGKEIEYPLVNFVRTNGFTALHQRPSVSVGDKVKKGDLLADTSTSDQRPARTRPKRLVAFMCWSAPTTKTPSSSPSAGKRSKVLFYSH
jgi:DNA-directed RNA polymerase subunit beta